MNYYTSGPYYMDITVNGVAMGSSPLLSVPYALYAASGNEGPKGDPGPMGLQGEPGQTGIQGDQGPKGDTGDQGPKGDTGDQGPKGDTGEQGPQGEVGEQGEPGESKWDEVDGGINYGEGYVGIGTTQPQEWLSVVNNAQSIGTAQMTRIAYFNRLFENKSAKFEIYGYPDVNQISDYMRNSIMLYSGDHNFKIAAPGTQANIQFITNGWVNESDEKMRITPNGYIGMGTTSPSTILHLHGAHIPTTGQFIISAPSGQDIQYSFQDGNDVKAYMWWDSDHSDLRLQNNVNGDLGLNPYGGNVGIGTTEPTEKLEVSGNLKVDGDIIMDGKSLQDLMDEVAALRSIIDALPAAK